MSPKHFEASGSWKQDSGSHFEANEALGSHNENWGSYDHVEQCVFDTLRSWVSD